MMKLAKIAIVGAPNVGKSSLFNNLSGRYATVSNYPGTTVELFKANINIEGRHIELTDTPGMYSMLPLSEEERIARLILFKDNPDVVIHVVAAKNLERALPLTLQLIEAGLPVMLVLNIIDEAHKEGFTIDSEELSSRLGIPVVETISVRGVGIKKLQREIVAFLDRESPKAGEDSRPVDYPPSIKDFLKQTAACLSREYFLSKKTISWLLLSGDEEIKDIVKSKEAASSVEKISRIEELLNHSGSGPVEYLINLALKAKARDIVSGVLRKKFKKENHFSRILGDITMRPLFGVPLLILFLYYGIYKLVGEFGAGVVVDFLEEAVFESHINPFFISLFEKITPFPMVNSLFVGEYGIITLGVRYAVAIVLPIVGIFFFVFSLAEDTGYLPRIGAMLDQLFKKIGLSGKAVIPIILGFGCDAMATMVTRILPTKRERIIATMLLSLSVPCSAQLGVIMAILSSNKKALLIWFITISGVFATSGFLLNKILKGKRPSFHIELPPLRMPRFYNIFTKTYMRLKWYFKEVLPLFIWASIIIWLGQITKVFDVALRFISYPLEWIGLSGRLSPVFLFGFFRRDYGAAGLYDLQKQGFLSMREILVAAVVLTLFLPCIAQFLMNIKERGAKMAFGIGFFILGFSFSIGFILNKILVIAGVN
jgi:ferrous iron transport protein B